MTRSMAKRALRRATRYRVLKMWLRRLKWKRWMHDFTEADHQRESVRRLESHRDLRNHNRKSCSYCNPLFKRMAEERAEALLYAQELQHLSLNLHDLLRPTPD